MTEDDRLLADYVAQVERAWQRLGVAPVVRGQLAVELEADLAGAREAGAPMAELVATHPVAFAVELARAADAPLLAPPPEPTRAEVVKTAVLGAIAGALVAWIFIETGPIGQLVLGAGPGLREQYAWIPLQSLAVLVTLAGTGGAVRWRFRASPAAGRIAWRVTVLALAGGVIAAAPLVGYAWATGYDTSAYALVIGTAIGAAIVGAAIRVGLAPYPARRQS